MSVTIINEQVMNLRGSLQKPDEGCWRISLWRSSCTEGEMASECIQMAEPRGCVCTHVWPQERVGMGQHPGTNMWRSEEDARHLLLLLLTSFLKTEFLT